eukprot:2536111-Pleurochrysis_carterae.AAC.1
MQKTFEIAFTLDPHCRVNTSQASQPSPFKADELIAVEFLNAVLASDVGTRIEHSIALTEAVVVRVCSLLSGKDPAVARLFSSVGLSAAYTVLSSLHHSQRVPAPAPGSNAIKRLPSPTL